MFFEPFFVMVRPHPGPLPQEREDFLAVSRLLYRLVSQGSQRANALNAKKIAGTALTAGKCN